MQSFSTVSVLSEHRLCCAKITAAITARETVSSSFRKPALLLLALVRRVVATDGARHRLKQPPAVAKLQRAILRHVERIQARKIARLDACKRDRMGPRSS